MPIEFLLCLIKTSIIHRIKKLRVISMHVKTGHKFMRFKNQSIFLLMYHFFTRLEYDTSVHIKQNYIYYKYV